MTSSLRNSIHRRNHKERSQLAHRSKLGILEKHADYVKRARDYHSKQDRLTRLKQKAAERNKDEFYFSMKNEKTKDGVHIKDRGNAALPTDIVKVLKTQDENYIRTMRAAGLKKIDKLKCQLTSLADLMKPDDNVDDDLDDKDLQVLSDAGIISGPTRMKKGRSRPKHIVFVDGEEEEPRHTPGKESPDIEEADTNLTIDMGDMDLGWKSTKESKKFVRQLPSAGVVVGDSDNLMSDDLGESRECDRRRLLTELSARLTRDRQLRYAERELEMHRLLMGKGGRRKLRGAERIGEGSEDEEDEDERDARKGKTRVQVQKMDMETYKPRVYKWRLERKR